MTIDIEFDHDDFWVFGYGSLMWRPDFPHILAHSALAYGYHRSLCALSTAHRGTKEKPGLIVGLDRGGSCVGQAYHVAPNQVDEVRAYLQQREMKSGVYEPKHISIRLRGGQRAQAVTFAVCRESHLYTGQISFDDKVKLVLQGYGEQGTSLEYLENTVAHLDDMNVPCEHLRDVLIQAQKKFNGQISGMISR